MIDSKYTVIKGDVKDLEMFEGHAASLASAKKNRRTAGIVATLQAAAGEAGPVHSAQAANDSADPVEGF